MSKDLILMNPDKDNPTIEQISSILREPSMISMETNAMAALDIFLKEKKHLHFVTEIQKNTDVSGKKLKERKEIVGIITLEDIIEALMDKKIEDEMDSDDENEKKNNNTN
jgi:CBS domain containing-hemolysin-like protein